MTLAVSDVSLLALSLGLTLAACLAAGRLRGAARWPAVAASLGAGVTVTPVVVFGAYRIAGGIVGSHQSRLGFLIAWIVCIAIAAAFAWRYGRRARPQ